MLSRKYQKLRSKSKGSLRIRRDFLPSIPVLSVFALLGILDHSFISIHSTSALEPKTSDTSISPIADTNIPSPDDADISPLADTAALSIISGPADTAATAAGRGTTTYRTYTIGITSDNVESYNLTIYGDDELSYDATNKLTSANGVTGNSLPADTWGYAFEELADSTSTGSTNDALTYTAPLANNVTTSLINNRPVNGTLNNYGKLVFAAKFGEDLPEGNYKANITLALTVTPRELITYTITYNANGGSGAPNAQSTITYDKSASFTIPSTTPTRNGYTFLGWHTNSTAASADTNYNPGKTITLTSTNQALNLYAIWQENLTLNQITEMQQITPSICANTSSGTTTTLKDTRDNNSYTITKLDDDNCWMTQNLRLIGSRTLTSTDSNVTSNFSLPTPITTLTASTFSTHNKAELYYSSSTLNTNGVYYSWYAATAGTITSSVTTDGANATSDICPRGWSLPTKAQYDNLLSKAGISGASGSTKIKNSPYNFLFAGFTNGSKLGSVGSNGYYWTRTVNNGNYAYRLRIDSSNVTTNGIYRFYGYPIRCIATSS